MPQKGSIDTSDVQLPDLFFNFSPWPHFLWRANKQAVKGRKKKNNNKVKLPKNALPAGKSTSRQSL